MNELQKLIKLRGMTIGEVAEQIGHGYHFTQKVIKRASRPLKKGGAYIYSNRAIETAVAELLGLSHDEAWGTGSASVLRRLIKAEIKKQARANERKMEEEWLHNGRIPKKQAAGNV